MAVAAVYLGPVASAGSATASVCSSSSPPSRSPSTSAAARPCRWSPPLPRRDEDDREVEAGIDEATLEAFPEVVYGEGRKARDGAATGAAATTQTCCPVCLENYGDSDMLWMLPDCGHLFHRECVDPWHRQRPTCPVCRTTPLAEVTPLALVRPS